jgi:ribonuclease D
LKLTADEAGVAPKMLANGEDLDRIAADGSEADVPAMSGWRKAVFGDKALKLIRGELALKFERRKVTVFETGAAAE